MSGSSEALNSYSSAMAAVRDRWRRRLTAYFTVRAPTKTAQDVESALDHFQAAETGGWDEMWRQAVKKFGPEPTPAEVRRAFWRNKLSAYFLLVDSSQTPQDIEECLDYFEKRLEGFEGMWAKVQRKYGLVVDAANAAEREQERMVGDVLVERKQHEALSGAIDPRVVVTVVVGGVSFRLYQAAPPESQFKFNSAVASEVKYCAEFPNPLYVCKVSEHVDGVTIDMETLCPEGTRIPGSLLVHYINSGAFPTGLVRKAYLEFIGGNPAKVFLLEGAVVESRQTANYRGNIFIKPAPSDGRIAYRLPSIDESRELVLARAEARGPRTHAFVMEQQGVQALYEPAHGQESQVGQAGTATSAKRIYPPPLGADVAAGPLLGGGDSHHRRPFSSA